MPLQKPAARITSGSRHEKNYFYTCEVNPSQVGFKERGERVAPLRCVLQSSELSLQLELFQPPRPPERAWSVSSPGVMVIESPLPLRRAASA